MGFGVHISFMRELLNCAFKETRIFIFQLGNFKPNLGQWLLLDGDIRADFFFSVSLTYIL